MEERPAIGKSSIFMDEILTAEDGPHGRSFEVVKGRHEEWRIKVVGCQLQILVEHFLKNLVEVSVSPLCVMNDCDGCRVFARS